MKRLYTLLAIALFSANLYAQTDQIRAKRLIATESVTITGTATKNGSTLPTEADLSSTATGKGASLVGILAPDNTAKTVQDITATTTGKGDALIGYKASGTGATDRTVHSWLSDQAANVMDYMTAAQIADVKANTGAVDVTAAIQAAITSLNATGGRVVFPIGTYLISAQINIATTSGDPITLEGQGMGDWSQRNAAKIKLGDNVTYVFQFGDGTTRGRSHAVKNLTFINPDSYSGTAIYFNANSNPIIENCGFYNYKRAVLAWKSYAGLIRKSGFTLCGDSDNTLATVHVWGSGADASTAWKVEDCVFESDIYRSLYMQSTDFWITDNYFEVDHDLADVIYAAGVGIIRGNTFYDPTLYCNPIISLYSYFTRVAENYFSGGVEGVRIYGAKNFVYGNYFASQSQYSIRTAQTDSTSIESTEIYGNTIFGGGTTYYAAIYIAGTAAQGVKCHNNHIFNRTGYGIDIVAGNYHEVTNNTIANYDGSTAMTTGIVERAGLTGTIIRGNTIIAVTSNKYSAQNATPVWAETASVVTTDDTQTTLWSFVLTDGHAYQIRAKVLAYKPGTATAASFVEEVLVTRFGANATLVEQAEHQKFPAATACAATFSVSTDTVSLLITGIAAETWNWSVELELIDRQ